MGWKLWFLLLQLLSMCIDSKESGQLLVKTIGREPDVTPICTNETQRFITMIVCKISTECRLIYQHGKGFENNCDSRFTLMTENQTVFLHLTGLTPEDSGNFTCECSRVDGTNILHLSITVEEDEDASITAEEEEDSSSSSDGLMVKVAVSVTTFIIITGVILGFILRNIHHRRRLVIRQSRPNTEPQDNELYDTFIQKENVLYTAAGSWETNINYLPNMTQI